MHNLLLLVLKQIINCIIKMQALLSFRVYLEMALKK